MTFIYSFLVQFRYFWQNTKRSLMFFLLSLAFLAGLREGNLKSTSRRLLTILVLTGHYTSAWLVDEDHVGWAIAALRIRWSAATEVFRGRPTCVRDIREPNSLILAKPFVTADWDTCKIAAILRCDIFWLCKISIWALFAGESSRLLTIFNAWLNTIPPGTTS